MSTSPTETEMRIRVTRDVKQPRIGVVSLVTVGGVVPHGDLVAGLHLDTAHLNVLGEIAPHEDNRRCPPNDLLDSGAGYTVELLPPNVPLFGVTGERNHAVADRISRCLVAGRRQQNEERR